NDPLAFRQLFDKYFQVLVINAIKLVKSGYWAEEVAQETLLEVWENREALSTIENPGGWLFRVAANKCVDKVRRQHVELRAQYFINQTVYEKQTVEQAGHYDYA